MYTKQQFFHDAMRRARVGTGEQGVASMPTCPVILSDGRVYECIFSVFVMFCKEFVDLFSCLLVSFLINERINESLHGERGARAF